LAQQGELLECLTSPGDYSSVVGAVKSRAAVAELTAVAALVLTEQLTHRDGSSLAGERSYCWTSHTSQGASSTARAVSGRGRGSLSVPARRETPSWGAVTPLAPAL